MKKILLICLIMSNIMICMAQVPVDHFNVGPYVVDYNGKGDIKYRLREDIDLYEFFGLQKDTTIISMKTKVPIKSTVQISARGGCNPADYKILGIECLWKQNIISNWYFNGGISLNHTNDVYYPLSDNVIEIGIPLQIELGKLNHQYASLYASVGFSPAFYATLDAWREFFYKTGSCSAAKNYGFLIAPVIEFGGNIPVGKTIIRIGLYGECKINCTESDYEGYRRASYPIFAGAKLGLVL